MKKKEVNISKLIVSSSVLLFISTLLKWISAYPDFIEKYYSGLLYINISIFLRAVTGWVPFSIGDILYLFAVTFCQFTIIQYCKKVWQKKVEGKRFLLALIKIIRAALKVYIIFILFWGLNYQRKGISLQMQIVPDGFTTEELKNLAADLVKKVNSASSGSNRLLLQAEPCETVFRDAITSYKEASYRYPFLSYQKPCVKNTLFSGVDNYLGIAGYYNPFTGEAQVNCSIPRFLLPYITTHEIAHQLGYTNENEANFTAYLVSKDSYENGFRYSAYFVLFNYANQQLFFRDSLSAKANFIALDSLVKNDEMKYENFLGHSSASSAHFSTMIYNNYLKINNQPKGIATYDAVIEMIIAYQKRYGDL